MLILKTLALEPMHGYGVALRIEQISHGVFRVNPGSLLPALSRMDGAGSVKSEWHATENNRRAKYYQLTAKGHKISGPRNRTVAAQDRRHRPHLEAPNYKRGEAIIRSYAKQCMTNILTGLETLLHKQQVENELDEELESYLQASVAQKVKSGMSPENARHAALVELGSRSVVKHQVWSSRWESTLDSVLLDMNMSLRTLAQNPGLPPLPCSPSLSASARTLPSSP